MSRNVCLCGVVFGTLVGVSLIGVVRVVARVRVVDGVVDQYPFGIISV